MLQGLATSAGRLFQDLQQRWVPESVAPASPVQPLPLAPLERLLLTDGVGRSLFDQFARHRVGTRPDDETGWVLLGHRFLHHAIALATLPGGSHGDSSQMHVRFDPVAQSLGSRIVRQADRRLTLLGVVHTHPGSLRHPSAGDYEGDRDWVGQLRGQEGVFGIGTADALEGEADEVSHQPRPNVQCLGELRFSWYSLRQGDRAYRPLPVELALGPDLAREVHLAWPTLEAHADPLERLLRTLASARIEVVPGDEGAGLMLTLPWNSGAVRVVLHGSRIRYFVDLEGANEVDLDEPRVDRGVFLLLAELASRSG